MSPEEKDNSYIKGRGAQINPKNRFLKGEYGQDHVEGIDDWEEKERKTQYIYD